VKIDRKSLLPREGGTLPAARPTDATPGAPRADAGSTLQVAHAAAKASDASGIGIKQQQQGRGGFTAATNGCSSGGVPLTPQQPQGYPRLASGSRRACGVRGSGTAAASGGGLRSAQLRRVGPVGGLLQLLQYALPEVAAFLTDADVGRLRGTCRALRRCHLSAGILGNFTFAWPRLTVSVCSWRGRQAGRRGGAGRQGEGKGTGAGYGY